MPTRVSVVVARSAADRRDTNSAGGELVAQPQAVMIASAQSDNRSFEETGPESPANTIRLDLLGRRPSAVIHESRPEVPAGRSHRLAKV